MPGIVGVVDIQNKTNIGSLLSQMCASVKHEDWYLEDKYVKPPFAIGRAHLGIFNPEPQPIFNQDKSLCIVMEGEIYDYQGMKRELISKGYKFQVNNDPEFILHLFEEYGEECVKKLNGIFHLIIWDNQRQKLTILNDRYGFRPLYYTENNGKLLFASELKAILEDRMFNKAINHVAVSDFFSFEFLLGNKTFFEGIYLLPPASIFVYCNNRPSIKEYWDLPYSEDYKNYSEEYYLEEFTNLLSRAIERQMKGDHKISVALSGGLDTRAIVAGINKKYHPIHTFTFGAANCKDAKFARLVADRLGTNHHFFKITPEYLIDYAEKGVWLTDCMVNCFHNHGISTLEDRKQYADVELSGMEATHSFYERDQMDPIKESYKQSHDDSILFNFVFTPLSYKDTINSTEIRKRLFSKSYYSKIKDYPMKSFNEIQQNSTLRKMASPFKRIEWYDLRQHQRRFTLNGPIYTRSKIELRMPLFDNDLMDFVSTLPPEFKAGDKILYTKGFFKLFPHLAEIPWTKTGLPLNAGNRRLKIYKTKRRIKRIFYGGIRRIFDKDLSPENTRLVADYNNWLQNDKNLQNFIFQTLLSKRAKSREYFNFDTIESILLRQFGRKENNTRFIGRLLTFELWNRLFIDGGRKDFYE